MSWLLENWFGTQESLEQVREEIREHLQKESYLGVSGLDHPEQSSNRVESKELDVIMTGPWENKLEELEEELLEYIHNELPPVVRDEVGILPFFTNVTAEGYLVLTFLRNACNRDILLQKLPLALATPDGEIVARKTFDMLPFGILGKFVSRPSEFLFRWNEFTRVPEEEVPLTLVFEGKPKKRELSPGQYADTNGLSTGRSKSIWKAPARPRWVPSRGEWICKYWRLRQVMKAGSRSSSCSAMAWSSVWSLPRCRSAFRISRAEKWPACAMS
jgi:SLAP domain-containing protein